MITNIENKQTYFWCCVLEDGTLFSEFNVDGSENMYNTIPRDKVNFFGLTSAKESYFFDLKTGEYHFKNQDLGIKQPIEILIDNSNQKFEITGVLPDNKKYEFYQFKSGYADINVFGNQNVSGSIIDAYVIGYNISKVFLDKNYNIDVRLTILPLNVPVTVKLEVKLKSEDGSEITRNISF